MGKTADEKTSIQQCYQYHIATINDIPIKIPILNGNSFDYVVFNMKKYLDSEHVTHSDTLNITYIHLVRILSLFHSINKNYEKNGVML